MEGDDTIDFLCNKSLDDSFCDSEPDIDENPVSVNIDLTNGWPYSKENFLILHYNQFIVEKVVHLPDLIGLCQPKPDYDHQGDRSHNSQRNKKDLAFKGKAYRKAPILV